MGLSPAALAALEQGTARFGVEATPGFVTYAAMLEEDGERLGLTGLRLEAARVRELLVDPLAACAALEPGWRVVDIGSGGGCPGIALALARPDLRLVLVESNRRKAEFLVRAVGALGLSAVVLAERSEALARLSAWREQLDAAVAKAVAALPVLLELALPLVRVGGLVAAFKGPALDEELAASERALGVLGGRVDEVRAYALEGRDYRLCLVRKVAATPAAYPRRPGVPAKTPLV